MRVTFLTTLAVCAVTASASTQPRTAFPDKRGLTPGDLARIVKLVDTVYQEIEGKLP